MHSDIESHYSSAGDLAEQIRRSLLEAGKSLDQLTTADLAAVDEFHIGGRDATLEVGNRMNLTDDCHVLDIGSGLGGPARTLAETFGCRVTGIDLTSDFCAAATAICGWLARSDKVRFVHGDATDLPFDSGSFDAAMTIHAAMNIPAKDALYRSVRRVLKPGRTFVVYDVLQGEGGPVLYPVPWARDPSISHLATPAHMRHLLDEAGFEIVDEVDATETSLTWFREMAARQAQAAAPPATWQQFLGADFPQMKHNQVRNLADKRIRTVTYVCRA